MREVRLTIKPVLVHGIEVWEVAVVTDAGESLWSAQRWSETGARHAAAFWLAKQRRALAAQEVLRVSSEPA